MRKIADTNELQSELRRLLAYAQSNQPSRARIASELRSISTRLAGAEQGYEGEGEEFYQLMKDDWVGAKYNKKSGHGSVRAGVLGEVQWHESGSDPAVVVTVTTPIYIKARPKDAADALEKISEVLRNTGV
jgi:phage gpG-like protein